MDTESFETRWNIVALAISALALVVVVALLAEPRLTHSVEKKIAIWAVVSVIGVAISTKPKMVLVAAMVITGIKLFWAAVITRSGGAALIAISLVGIACLIAVTDPVGAGLRKD